MLDNAHIAALSFDENADNFAVNRDEPWINAWYSHRPFSKRKIAFEEDHRQGGPVSTRYVVGFYVDSSVRKQSALFNIAVEFKAANLPRQIVQRRVQRIAMAAALRDVERALPPLGQDIQQPDIEAVVHLPTEFVPSRELTNYWIRGLRDHLNEVAAPVRYKRRWDAAFEDTEANKALAVRLKRMLAVIGNRQAYGIEPKKPLADHGRFSLSFQHHVIDRIPLRPDEYGEFFTLLYREFESFLRDGGSMTGSWGKLIIEQSAMRIRFKEKKNNRRGWKRAEVLG